MFDPRLSGGIDHSIDPKLEQGIVGTPGLVLHSTRPYCHLQF